MNIPGYGETFQCPYNKAHQICKSRAQTHLIKCRKNYPDVKKIQCPFNATHLLNEPELKIHVADCPDRATFDCYKYEVQTNSTKREFVQPKEDFKEVECEENWDDDDDVPTYDPQQYVKNAPVMRSLYNATPSERSAFRREEQLRINTLKEKRRYD